MESLAVHSGHAESGSGKGDRMEWPAPFKTGVRKANWVRPTSVEKCRGGETGGFEEDWILDG